VRAASLARSTALRACSMTVAASPASRSAKSASAAVSPSPASRSAWSALRSASFVAIVSVRVAALALTSKSASASKARTRRSTSAAARSCTCRCRSTVAATPASSGMPPCRISRWRARASDSKASRSAISQRRCGSTASTCTESMSCCLTTSAAAIRFPAAAARPHIPRYSASMSTAGRTYLRWQVIAGLPWARRRAALRSRYSATAMNVAQRVTGRVMFSDHWTLVPMTAMTAAQPATAIPPPTGVTRFLSGAFGTGRGPRYGISASAGSSVSDRRASSAIPGSITIAPPSARAPTCAPISRLSPAARLAATFAAPPSRRGLFPG